MNNKNNSTIVEYQGKTQSEWDEISRCVEAAVKPVVEKPGIFFTNTNDTSTHKKIKKEGKK